MEDALAVVGRWIGLLQSARFAVAEVSRDCEERIAAGSVEAEEDFRQGLDNVFGALSDLLVHLEEQEEALEDEMEDGLDEMAQE